MKIVAEHLIVVEKRNGPSTYNNIVKVVETDRNRFFEELPMGKGFKEITQDQFIEGEYSIFKYTI